MRADQKWVFTSESVTEGHPDKLCDAVSDAVLDAYLAGDPFSKVACECAVTTGMMLIMGEITSNARVDIQAVARDTIRAIGYTDAAIGFDADTCAVLVSLDRQSPDIAMGVDDALENRHTANKDIGAGDQGMMFGYACDETPELMPLAASLAHGLTRRLSQARKLGELPYLRPDGKAQVTVEYRGAAPLRVDTVVVSTQHDPDVSQETIRRDIIQNVVRPVIGSGLLDANTQFLINPTGRFVVGGPQGDSGLTGRKIIVDTYGGYGRHGGGSFSGKDPTKVDRSAAYMARYIAKNIVAAGLASRCELEVAYAIGVARPVSIHVNTFGTGTVGDDALAGLVANVFDLRPAAIIDALGLRSPIYKNTTNYGHFGREDMGFSWEKTDMAAALKAAIK